MDRPKRKYGIARAVLAAVVALMLATPALAEPREFTPAKAGITVPVAYSQGDGILMIAWPDGDNRFISRIYSGDRAAWAPDGRRMALTNYPKPGEFRLPRLIVMDLPNGPSRELATDEGWVAAPAWSPDGTRIAYTHGEVDLFRTLVSNGVEVMVIGADGSGLRPLTSEISSVFPSWSPDSRFVAVQGVAPTDTFEQVYAIDVTTGTTRRITEDGDGSHMHPAWSPDGRSIAYVLLPRSDVIRGYLPQELWIVNVDGSGRRRLVVDDERRSVYAPSWTPDGRIVFATRSESDSRDSRLEIVDVNGRGRSVLSSSMTGLVPAVAPRLAISPPPLGQDEQPIVSNAPPSPQSKAALRATESRPASDAPAANPNASGEPVPTTSNQAAPSAMPGHSRSGDGGFPVAPVLLVILLVVVGVMVGGSSSRDASN